MTEPKPNKTLEDLESENAELRALCAEMESRLIDAFNSKHHNDQIEATIDRWEKIRSKANG